MKHHVLSIHLKDQSTSGRVAPFKILILLVILLTSYAGSLLAATINVVPGPVAIQTAINVANPGDIIVVAAGIYNENVVITKSLTLISSGGAGATTINGSATPTLPTLAGSELGTIVIGVGVNDVTIGGAGQGFTINGFDGTPGLERAALYFRGVHNNITVRGNNIVANGEAAILTEYGQAVNNLTFEGNTVSGQTFLGTTPAGCGFDDQYTLQNVPRALVTISTGTGVLFSNNNITGTAGGPSTVAGCETIGQGRSLVEIFGDGLTTSGTATICGNNFAGTVYRTSSSLVADGKSISVKNNVFNGAGLNGNARHLYIDDNALSGANPSTIADVASMNTFLSEGYYVAGGNRIYKNSTQATAAGTPIAANSGSIANASCPTCLGTTTPAAPTAVGNTAICDDDNNGIQRVRVDQTCASGTMPVWYINSAPASGVSGATVITNTNNANYGRLTYDQPVGTTTYTYACQSANSCLSAQSPGLDVTVSQLSAPTGVSVTVNGTTVNEGQTSVLCDTDTESPNALILAATCSSGTLQWRSKTGEADWTNYASLPSSQASDGVAVQYQARCRQQPCTAESGIVTITINPKPSVESTSVTDVKCMGGNDGSITVTASGGTAGHTYSKDGGANYGNSPIFAGLSAGNYSIRVKDASGCESAIQSVSVNEPATAVSVSISGNTSVVYTPTPGSNCTILTANPSGGTPGSNPDYTYMWSTGETTKSINPCPVESTSYSVTVTDANGCTATATVTVNVKDVRCGPGNTYVTICYYGTTQCVRQSTAKNYLKLGATLGACDSGNNSPARIGVDESTSDSPFELSVKGYPNPTQGDLTVEVMSKISGSVQMQVLDLTGRAVQQRTEQLLEGKNEIKFDLTAQPSGTYLIRAVDALQRQGVVRVNKQ